jgi:hypothetical protein
MKKLLFAFALTALLGSLSLHAEEKDGKDQKGQNEDKEEKVAVADIPKVVVDAVNTARPGATIVEADKETKKDGTVVFEVDVTLGGKKYEVKVDGTGKVLGNKEEKEEEKHETKTEKK